MRISNLVHVSLAAGLTLLLLVAAGCADSSNPTAAVADTESTRSGEFEVAIAIAPATLVLGSPGDCVTVHADIPYADVDPATLALSGVAPYLVKADSRGDLVAKFARISVEGIVSPPEATLTLTGLTLIGDPFVGSDTVEVQ